MNVQEIEALFSDEVQVKHNGKVYTLKAPSIPEALEFGRKNHEYYQSVKDDEDGNLDAYLKYLANAVELCIKGLPEGIGERIVLQTGGMYSPIGIAAGRLCGMSIMGDADEEEASEDDHLFTGSQE